MNMSFHSDIFKRNSSVLHSKNEPEKRIIHIDEKTMTKSADVKDNPIRFSEDKGLKNGSNQVLFQRVDSLYYQSPLFDVDRIRGFLHVQSMPEFRIYKLKSCLSKDRCSYVFLK